MLSSRTAAKKPPRRSEGPEIKIHSIAEKREGEKVVEDKKKELLLYIL
jgi:hypothetical protein